MKQHIQSAWPMICAQETVIIIMSIPLTLRNTIKITKIIIFPHSLSSYISLYYSLHIFLGLDVKLTITKGL